MRKTLGLLVALLGMCLVICESRVATSQTQQIAEAIAKAKQAAEAATKETAKNGQQTTLTTTASTTQTQLATAKPDSRQQFGGASATAPGAKTRIVYVGGDDTIGFAIYRKDLSDSNAKETRLTPVSFSKTVPAGKPVEEPIPSISPKSCPRWSPDGKKIAFIGGGPIRGAQDYEKLAKIYTQYTSVEDIWVMNEDGQAVKPLVQNQVGTQGGIAAFHWSADGNQIAFIGYHGLCIVDVNTRKISELPRGGMAKGRSLSTEFCWSPDGKAIVGIDKSGSTGDEKICILSIDGKCIDVTQGGFKLHPYWWPDGKITFCRGDASYVEMDSNFWIMDSDGSNQARVKKGRNIVEMSSGEGDEYTSEYVYPFWLTDDGRTIAFPSRIPDPNSRTRLTREIDAVCIKKVGESSLGKTITCSLNGVYFSYGLYSEKSQKGLPYDIYFELK